MPLIKKSSLKSVAINLILFLVVYVAIQAYQGRDAPGSGLAPDIRGVSLSGERVSLADYRGQPVLLYFWATWCGVCLLTRDSIDAIAVDHPVITVAIQSGEDHEVLAYTQEHGFTPPVINDRAGRLSDAYGVRAFPSVFILNSKGEIEDVEIGLSSEWGLRLRLWWAANV